MANVTAEETKWIENKLIPNISNQLGRTINKVRWEISYPQNTFFLSHVYFITLNFEEFSISEPSKLELVIKKPPNSGLDVNKMSMDKQFHNEILFYKKIAKNSSQFPRCFYTAEGSLDETVIVIENITTMGYECCEQVYDLSFDYVLAAVREIGRMHGIGYVMKEREPEELKRVVNDIRESRFVNEGSWMDDFLDIVATRPIDWLRKQNCETIFCDKLEKHFGNAFREIMMESVKPIEPLATICHGDFTRNNIFFRKIDGKIDAMLFDFAYVLYASPAIDLSTFLYLNCKTVDRIERFDEIFRAYHDALIEYLRNAGIKESKKYSYENFLADYKRRATFGFMIAIFFLPIIRGLCTCDIEYYHKDPKAGALAMREGGGEAMTEEFGKMVLELRDTGCLEHI